MDKIKYFDALKQEMAWFTTRVLMIVFLIFVAIYVPAIVEVAIKQEDMANSYFIKIKEMKLSRECKVDLEYLKLLYNELVNMIRAGEANRLNVVEEIHDYKLKIVNFEKKYLLDNRELLPKYLSAIMAIHSAHSDAYKTLIIWYSDNINAKKRKITFEADIIIIESLTKSVTTQLDEYE